jgi:colanic acid biosynthesis glycosyl transferase WcaI
MLFVPARPKEEMPGFWGLSDVALVHLKDSSLFRTVIPSKIFEAMGMGLPIILVAPEGEASKIILEENAGAWVPANDRSWCAC